MYGLGEVKVQEVLQESIYTLYLLLSGGGGEDGGDTKPNLRARRPLTNLASSARQQPAKQDT